MGGASRREGRAVSRIRPLDPGYVKPVANWPRRIARAEGREARQRGALRLVSRSSEPRSQWMRHWQAWVDTCRRLNRWRTRVAA
jgi:hypothetical protein